MCWLKNYLNSVSSLHNSFIVLQPLSIAKMSMIYWRFMLSSKNLNLSKGNRVSRTVFGILLTLLECLFITWLLSVEELNLICSALSSWF